MPCHWCSAKNFTAHHGLKALSTSGSAMMFHRPMAASDRNQTVVIGPNTRPTFSVPKRWAANTPSNTAMVIGSTKGLSPGAATSSPSTAPSTEIAGVIILSP